MPHSYIHVHLQIQSTKNQFHIYRRRHNVPSEYENMRIVKIQKSIKIFVNFYLTYIEVPLTIRQYSMFDVYIDFLKESTII